MQIMVQIKHMIATGTLKPGDQLPTVRQMAADLRVNFNTVARAYRMLDETEFISTQHGRGTFILEPISETQSEKLLEENLMQLTLQYLNDAHDLGFSSEQVQRVILEQIQQQE
jgi:GntR family transcriptional regulator